MGIGAFVSSFGLLGSFSAFLHLWQMALRLASVVANLYSGAEIKLCLLKSVSCHILPNPPVIQVLQKR